jgi:Zn-dependent protease
MLPVIPLDGGQALYHLLCALFSQQVARKVCGTTGFLVITGILSAGMFLGIVLKLGVLPVLLAVVIALRIKK